jgi:hypothetical protein
VIPDPPASDAEPLAGGEGGPARGSSHDGPRAAGHICAGCGQPLAPWTRDLWCWASETTIAYWPCLLVAIQ